MKASLATIAIFLLAVISFTESAPAEQVPEKSEFDFGVFQPAIADHATRHRRVTCDLLSLNYKGFAVNHSLCAAHCWAMLRGFRGGHCDDKGICICRK